MVVFVVAAGENNELGNDNRLLWHLPDDFKRFRQITTGHHIVMGRKTFESLPGILPNRTHVVISRNSDYNPKNCIVVNSLEKALEIPPAGEDVFIIGGGEIFRLAMPVADKIELTRVHATFRADAFFPEIDPSQWELAQTSFHPADEKHEFSFTFETYLRKKP